MSAGPKPPALWHKPSPLEMAQQAEEITYSELHERIFAAYTGQQYSRNLDSPPDQPFFVSSNTVRAGGDPFLIKLFVLAPTSTAERSKFKEFGELIRRVENLSTLNELSREEVEAAFWVGARLAYDYLPSLCQAIAPATCRPVSPPVQPKL